MSKVITMIKPDVVHNHAMEFQAVLGFPNANGALDGYHLVSHPKECAVDYHNYKGWYV